jgi:hypothetical protein
VKIVLTSLFAAAVVPLFGREAALPDGISPDGHYGVVVSELVGRIDYQIKEPFRGRTFPWSPAARS